MMYKKSLTFFCAVFLLHFLCSATQTASQPAQEKTQATYYQIEQPPTFNALYTELAKTLCSFPMDLISIVTGYSHQAGWFLPFMSLKMKGYQRNTGSIDNDNIHLTIFGIKDNLPLTRHYILSTKQDEEEDDTFPHLWNKTEIITDLQKKLGSHKHKHLIPHWPLDNKPDGITPKVIEHVKKTLSNLFTKKYAHQHTICLQQFDSQAVIVGQNSSVVYITVSPQAFALACKNYDIYLQEERDKLGLSKKFSDKDTWYGMDLDRIIEQFPDEVMDELARDETGEQIPVVCDGGTLEECIQHVKDQVKPREDLDLHDDLADDVFRQIIIEARQSYH